MESFAAEFADRLLTKYTAEIRQGLRRFSRKEINDPLWGTISLTPPEVALIDSPLVQRLRGIRQLGVVHWVYPGAVHTRFEHTLGVLYHIQELATAINVLGHQKNLGELIDASKFQLLKLTGLAHDIGHAAFSHVSEKALEQLSDVSTIGSDFARSPRGETKSLSEIMAYYIVKSPAFRDFMLTLLDKCDPFITFASDRDANATEIVDKMSAAIIGNKIDDRLPLLHQLISGPFDADKLDYSVRDTRFAGTPSITDISRLVQKLAIKEVDGTELPEDVGGSIEHSGGRYVLFGVKWSGISTLDELHLSRVLLFAKIYRHAKVIAIEEMLSTCLSTLAPITSSKELIRLVYDLSDESILSLTVEQLRDRLYSGDSSHEEAPERLDRAAAILEDVRWRRLHTKAFQFQLRYPADPFERDEAQKQGLIQFLEEVEHPEKGRQVRLDLLTEVERILELAPIGDKLSRIALESQLTIRVLGKTPGATQIARAFLLPVSGPPIPFRDYQVNRAAWADSYLTDQPAGFIFCPSVLGDTVYLAIERILREKYQVRLPLSALEASKRDRNQLESRKQSLAAAGYYKDAPFDIRPFPPQLRMEIAYRTEVDFKDVLSAYHGPERETEGHFITTGRERVEMWLRQFETDSHVECALRLLPKMKMLTRADTLRAVRSFVSSNPDFQGAVVVPFGDARDSSAIQTYFTADLQGSYISGCTTLEHAARSGSKTPIIFIDDFLGSGGQSGDILATGFGVPAWGARRGEQRNLFGNDVQLLLKSTKVGFVFTAAWSDGIINLRSITKKLGIDATVFAHIMEEDLPFAFDSSFEGIKPATVESFKARCVEIGRSLALQMTEKKGKNAAKKAEERALGYGNRAMLLTSPFNVPTQTLTAIWGTGIIDGAEWEPLMGRRKKT